MRLIHIIFMGFLLILAFGCSPVLAGDSTRTITENECAHLPDAEIIWHISELRWLCCIPKNEDEYESCIPISDMEPLSNSHLNPFPPKTTGTIRP
jgi:hypothetical protein